MTNEMNDQPNQPWNPEENGASQEWHAETEEECLQDMLPDGDQLDDDADTDIETPFDTTPSPAEVGPNEFGVERFKDTEPQFEGTPPEDFRKATSVPFIKATTAHAKEYGDGIFYDMFEVKDVRSADGRPVSLKNVALEYLSPEGRTVIHIDPGTSIETRFLDFDGNTVSYCRYYADGPRGAYEPIQRSVRKDTLDPEATGVLDLQGFSLTDLTAMRHEAFARAQAAKQTTHPGMVDPLASVEELEYIMQEIVANAEPVTRTIQDVHDAVEGQLRMPREALPDLVEARNRAYLFSSVIDVYRERMMTPEMAINGESETEVRYTAADGSNTVTNTTGINPLPSDFWVPNPAHVPAPLTYARIEHAEELTASQMAEVLAQHGAPAVIADAGLKGTLTKRVRLGLTRTWAEAEHTQEKRLPPIIGRHMQLLQIEGMERPVALTRNVFLPTNDVLRTIRNYLWTDVR